MKGIQFVVNDSGKKTAVLIDLQEHAEIWEDIYDSIVCKARKNEPRESLNTVRKKLIRAGKLDG